MNVEPNLLEIFFSLLFAAAIAATTTGCGLTADGLATTGYLREVNRGREIQARIAEAELMHAPHPVAEKKQLQALLEGR